MNRSISAERGEAFVNQMVASMRAVAEQLVAQVSTGEETLEDLEQAALQSAQRLGNTLLGGLCGLCGPRSPAAAVVCACGGPASDERMRTVQTKTILDTITVRRAYSVCAASHQGVAPLDQQLGLWPGGVSAGWDEVVAVLEVTPASWEPAVAVLAKLSLVSVCATSARAATETVGALVVADEEAQVTAAWAAAPSRPARPVARPARRSVSMEGVLVTIRGEGWKEIK